MIRNRSSEAFSLLFGVIFTLIYDFIYLLLQYFREASFIAILLLYCLCMIITPLYMLVIRFARDKRFFRIGAVLASLIFWVVVICINRRHLDSNELFFQMLPAFLGVVSSVVFEKLYYKLKEEQFHSCISGVIYAVLVTAPTVVLTICSYLNVENIGLLSGIAVFLISVIYYLISRIKCSDSHAFTVIVIVFVCAFSIPVAIIGLFYNGNNGMEYIVYIYLMAQIMLCTIGIDLMISIIYYLKNKKLQALASSPSDDAEENFNTSEDQ